MEQEGLQSCGFYRIFHMVRFGYANDGQGLP